MKNPVIKNIVFDLGNVILNIDIALTIQRFSELTGYSIAEIKQKLAENEVFEQYETGRWDDTSFLNQLKQIAAPTLLSDTEITDAWNALLLDIPLQRITFLQKLREKYRLFLLSNTSAMHIRKVNEILATSTPYHKLDELFEKVYYSFELGCAKPHAEIYLKVLADANILPHETLFLDDNEDNIKGASKLGINTIHVVAPTTMIDYLEAYV